MDYGKIFSRAWEITWEHKYLWVLGFLVALGTGGGGSGSRTNFSTGGTPSPEVAGQMENFYGQYGPLLIGLGCLIFIIGIVLWLVRMVAEAGLISAVDRIEQGSKMTLAEAFSSGTPFLGRMIVVNLVLYLPFILVALVGAGSCVVLGGAALFGAAAADAPEAALGSLGVLIPFACLLACALVILGILVGAVYPFAARSAVLGNMGAIDSIRYAWNLFRRRLADVLVIWIVLILVGLVFGFAAGLILVPLAFLAAGPALFNAMSGGSFGAAEIATVVVGGLCIGVLAALINAVLTTYQSSVFTLAYRQLAE